MHKISSSLYKEKEDYIDVKKVIQINFNNFDKFKKNKEIYKFMYMEESTKIVLPENSIKYYIDLEYMYKMCYNKAVKDLSEFERYCLLLKAETRKFAREIAGDDSIMKKIKDKIEELNEDENILGLYDAEEEARRVWNTKIKYAERLAEEKVKEAVKDAEKQRNIEIAKNMLNKGIDIETIVECTNLTKEEIEELR